MALNWTLINVISDYIPVQDIGTIKALCDVSGVRHEYINAIKIYNKKAFITVVLKDFFEFPYRSDFKKIGEFVDMPISSPHYNTPYFKFNIIELKKRYALDILRYNRWILKSTYIDFPKRQETHTERLRDYERYVERTTWFMEYMEQKFIVEFID